jgi:serine phosphatase RsbU (regulator of sigma subunit)
LLTSPTAYFSNRVSDGADGAQVVVVSVPILGAEGHFTGALLGMFRLGQATVSPFYASIVRLRIGNSGSIYVIDGQRYILFDSVSDRVGQLYTTDALPALNLSARPQANLMNNLAEQQIIASSAPIPGTPWTLVAEVDRDVLTATTQGYVNLLLLLLGLGMVLPGVGVVLLTRRRQATFEVGRHKEQEKHIARLIRETLLPGHAPMLPGWNLLLCCQPAPITAGDFHDFLILPDGRLMLSIGEINETGVVASMTMAATRATLRGAARRLLSPAQALKRSNEFLYPEIAAETAITCIFAVLDPTSGTLHFANAGHDAPYHHIDGADDELRQSAGAPLGMELSSTYEEYEVTIQAGECFIFHSSGLLEVTNDAGEPFGQARLKEIMRRHHDTAAELAGEIMEALREFSNDAKKAKKAITLIVLERPALDPATSDNMTKESRRIATTERTARRVPTAAG